MEYNSLGVTGLTVSQVGLGSAPLGGLFGPIGESEAIALVHEALDLGINFIDTSAYYGNAEERIGKALTGRRSEVILGTKAGRYGFDDFDFSPERIRRSAEESLRLLQTDYVDILQLHDIDFVPLGPLFEDSYAELLALRDEGKCRFIGMTGYAAPAMVKAMRTVDLDVLLTFAHATLLDDTLNRELAPVAEEREVGLINAAAVSLGLLTPNGVQHVHGHPATPVIHDAASRMVALCTERGIDIAFIANQYAIQRSGCATTLIGTAKSSHLRSAIAAATSKLDDELISELLALRPPVQQRTWPIGLAENNLAR